MWKTVATVCCLAGCGFAVSWPAQSQPVTFEIIGRVPGCHDAELFDKITTFMAQKDFEAANKLFFLALASGNCRWLEAGQRVVIQESHFFGHHCVRIPGETECWYTLNGAIK
jgi:hypothetical protein